MSRNLNLLKNCEKQLDQKTPEHRPHTKTELADITGKEIKLLWIMELTIILNTYQILKLNYPE